MWKKHFIFKLWHVICIYVNFKGYFGFCLCFYFSLTEMQCRVWRFHTYTVAYVLTYVARQDKACTKMCGLLCSGWLAGWLAGRIECIKTQVDSDNSVWSSTKKGILVIMYYAVSVSMSTSLPFKWQILCQPYVDIVVVSVVLVIVVFLKLPSTSSTLSCLRLSSWVTVRLGGDRRVMLNRKE